MNKKEKFSFLKGKGASVGIVTLLRGSHCNGGDSYIQKLQKEYE